MLPELGHFALILALLLSALQAFFGIFGPQWGRDRWVAAVAPAVAGQFVMIGTSIACLVYAYLTLPDVRRLRAANPPTTYFMGGPHDRSPGHPDPAQAALNRACRRCRR